MVALRLPLADDPSDAGTPASKRLGIVYTPRPLASWAGQLLAERLDTGNGAPRVLDPACGDGALLKAVREATGGVVDLVGIDVDSRAVARCRRRVRTPSTFATADSLVVDLDRLVGTADGVIANPPWGADLAHTTADLRASGLRLARGQYDSFELFIDRMISWAPSGTPMVFIIPDSLFLPEHEPLRRILVECTSLELIARLGEGFFPGVYRGTTVIALRGGAPGARQMVRCVRLTPAQRRQVLTSETTLASVAREVEHRVPQARFRSAPKTSFSIDTRVTDEPTIARFGGALLLWSSRLTSGRGLELGKEGLVTVCPRCESVRPITRRPVVTCATCGSAFAPSDALTRSVVREHASCAVGEGWAPLIVGADVDRYTAVPSRAVRLAVPGLDYKDDRSRAGRRLLVRKTGVGLQAAIDSSGAHTNQVVFHFTARPGTPPQFLDYMQGVLCSRVMLAFHLRQSGEVEWRTHPYVTPKLLRSLPVPDPFVSESAMSPQALAIARAARARAQSPTLEHDLMVDRLVAGLLGFSSQDCAWTMAVIDAAQPLKAIRGLRLDDTDAFAPLTVG